MKIIDGIVYADTETEYLEVTSVNALDDMMLIVGFNNNQQRLFDVTSLLDMPAFIRLKDKEIFKKPKIVDGVVTWCDGEIDIAPETMLKDGFKYEHINLV